MFKPIETQRMGYQLINIGVNYQLRSPRGLFVGSLEDVCHYAVNELGFSIEEIEIGILEMDKNFDDTAEYGYFKKFMYTHEEYKDYDFRNRN